MANVPNALEILPKIWTAWVGLTSITDRQTDGRGQQIANVNVSSRSLKIYREQENTKFSCCRPIRSIY